ncbi:alpha/beta hydrolase [Brachybacterium atlanticum]|uniref:alpha/beta hydrolase n=1 Tax=Brachybacterium atlanticum TaxID=2911888 RepID=UPI0027E4A4F8|nr:alpha/beta hydrolase [Brachybacterium atlanticum]
MLSLSGSEDGLSTPEKIAEHREALPGGAEMVEIAGASHASFGDYGPQSGDVTATIDDAEMDAAVEDAVAELLGSMP